MQPGTEGCGLYDYDGCHHKLDNLLFHESWDWLMPVMAKLVENFGDGWIFEEGYDLKVRHQEVVKFIKQINN